MLFLTEIYISRDKINQNVALTNPFSAKAVPFQIQQYVWKSTFWTCLFVDILCNFWESFFGVVKYRFHYYKLHVRMHKNTI